MQNFQRIIRAAMGSSGMFMPYQLYKYFASRIVEAKDSPSRKPLLLAASVDSGTVSVFEINGKHYWFFIRDPSVSKFGSIFMINCKHIWLYV